MFHYGHYLAGYCNDLGKKIHVVYGNIAIVDGPVPKWYVKSRNLKLWKSSGRPTVVDNDQIELLIKINPSHMT